MAAIKYFHLVSITTFLLMQSCLADNQETQNTRPCATLWIQQVEMLLLTQDSTGHGPDLGSSEWKSVIEFKLGIRG
ncbi:MAG: hypothetical protein ACC707_14205 [Thiohalomonadales bacterium]